MAVNTRYFWNTLKIDGAADVEDIVDNEAVDSFEVELDQIDLIRSISLAAVARSDHRGLKKIKYRNVSNHHHNSFFKYQLSSLLS